VATLAEAVADCRLVLGCTARARRVQLEELLPGVAAQRALAKAAEVDGEVAFVFGRERTGLTNEELQLCHLAVHIPSNPEFSSLNLAAAVQVLAYELRMASLGGVEAIERAAHRHPNVRIVVADEDGVSGLHEIPRRGHEQGRPHHPLVEGRTEEQVCAGRTRLPVAAIHRRRRWIT
jgi:tRNA (cytidine32/uridine32-2'-O)-methyltransferase